MDMLVDRARGGRVSTYGRRRSRIKGPPSQLYYPARPAGSVPPSSRTTYLATTGPTRAEQTPPPHSPDSQAREAVSSAPARACFGGDMRYFRTIAGQLLPRDHATWRLAATRILPRPSTCHKIASSRSTAWRITWGVWPTAFSHHCWYSTAFIRGGPGSRGLTPTAISDTTRPSQG